MKRNVAHRLRKSSFSKNTRLILFLAFFAAIGTAIILFVSAATGTSSTEPEAGLVIGNAMINADTTASNNQYVQFGKCPSGQTGVPPNCAVPSTATLPPGSTLPDDGTCAARVVRTAEIRPQNATYNATAGHQKNLSGALKSRVDGNFTGSTDEILQWTACKWGIDPDIVRAQAAKESYWTMTAKGDYANNPSVCPPNHGLGIDGVAGQCPESYGILQVRYQYHGPPAGLDTWPDAEVSTAYNADYTYEAWRDCFEGNLGWLNTVEHTGTYAAGDAWGCVGIWFAGRWKTPDANTYIQAVQDYYNQKIWTTGGFINYR